MARYSGNAGAVYVGGTTNTGGTKVLDVYDWVWDANTELLNASIKGDVLERWVASHGMGYKFTAKRRSQGAASVFPAFVFDSAVNNTRGHWRLDLVDANGSFVQIYGEGFAKSTSLNAPADQAVEETFELAFDEAVVVTL
jgi:hypothetical protein